MTQADRDKTVSQLNPKQFLILMHTCVLARVHLRNIKSNLLTNSSMSTGLLGRGLVAPFDLDVVLALDGECFLDDDLLWDLGLKNDFIFFLGLTVEETYGNATRSNVPQ